MASVTMLRGTRKTYSFEERKILISLINKHIIVEDRKSDPISVCKRKSAWTRIADEYNSMVGPQGARSAMQLRRCWENMKACKRLRDEKRSRCGAKAAPRLTKERIEEREASQCWEGITCGQNTSEAPTSIGTVGLPPNVVFEPKDSEPFTLQSVCTTRPQNLSCSRKDADSCRDFSFNTFGRMITDETKFDVVAPLHSPTNDYDVSLKTDANSPMIGDQPAVPSNELGRGPANPGPRSDPRPYTLISPSVVQEHNRKKKSARQEEQLHVLALSEAQMKVDIAAMLKEEARIKLEEAHYRKEEARLRMLLFTYKLDRIKED